MKKQRKFYNKEVIDFLIVVLPDEKIFYMLPATLLPKNDLMFPKNSGVESNKYKHYCERWDLLEKV